MSVIDCVRVRHSYTPATPVLHDVDLAIGDGERVALLGRSGSGKSTLVRAMLALEPLASGAIHCDGRVVTPGPVRRLRWFRRLVQYVPQDPGATLDPQARVLDIVAEPLRRLCGVTDRARLTAAAATVLEAVGLPAALHTVRARDLSGGQAQRVAIARALAPEPRLLIADEPISGLDAPLRAHVIDALRHASASRGTALLLVTHDVSAAAALSDRIAVMHDGRIVEDRRTGDLLAAPDHPETRALLAAVPRFPA
ncbi:ABC transporter ATP-binding protein [Actinoplanes utahensis]|uniref:ABC transporter ATP-binding protein n=1 Tax=Actinoplanes utahensis TaxID=1869 RepID=UPI00068D9023|nr:ABC transporter ATP-binding protein [Actinoplanes utahensis]GIF32517.1 dipeptide/oligopeptide/nickel ABC transporter ATP-binding protein [Actinoplanes utahensis]